MSHDELGDQLSALARASQTGSDDPRSRPSQPQQQQPAADEDDDYITAEVEDESGQDIAQAPFHPHAPAAASHAASEQAYGFAGQQPAYRAPYRPPAKKKVSEFKAVAAPILMTVGVMLLIPAFWAVLVLTGAGVPMADREDAKSMAKVMLVCWPLSVTLIIPAALIFAQIAADRKAASPR